MNKTNALPALITGWLLCSSMVAISSPVYAQSPQSETRKLGEYEIVVFGEQRNRDSVEKRLAALEKSLLGKTGSGSVTTRLDEIGKLVAGKSSSEYLPPVPPVMDRSQFMKEPVMAPQNRTADNASRSPQYDEPPPAAENSDRVTGMLREAMNLYSSGKSADAERVYQKVLAIDFRNPDANFNLGAIAEDKGDLKAAAGYYRTALRSNPNDDELKDALASVEKKLRSDMAKAPSQSPSQSPSQASAAGASDPAMKQIASDAAAEYRKGNFDEAISKLNFLAKRSPYDANVQFALGQAWRGKGNNYEALKHLRAAATLNPKNDLYVKTANQVQGEHDDSGSNPLTASNDDSRPAGEITPFTGAATSDRRRSNLQDMDLGDIAASLLRGQRYSDVPLSGSVDAYGRSYGGFPGMIPGFSNGSGSLRVRRAVQAGLAGAAMGAMTNRGRPGGMSRGAMQGAMYGGLFGLMTGY